MLRFITWMDGWSFTSIVKGTYMYVCFKLLSFQKHRETDAAKKIGIESDRKTECLNYRNHEALGLLRRSSINRSSPYAPKVYTVSLRILSSSSVPSSLFLPFSLTGSASSRILQVKTAATSAASPPNRRTHPTLLS